MDIMVVSVLKWTSFRKIYWKCLSDVEVRTTHNDTQIWHFSGDFLQGSSAGGTSIWIGYLGDNPPHGPGPGGFLSQGGQADYREAAPAASGWELVVTALGGGNFVVGTGGGGGACPKEAAYYCKVHCDTNDSGPLWGSGVEDGMWVSKRWWYQEALELEGARAGVAGADGEDTEEAEGKAEGGLEGLAGN